MSTVGDAHTIRVLAVESRVADRMHLQDALADAEVANFKIEFASSLRAALERLANKGIDVVLLDLSLPDARGLEAVVRMQPLAREIPVIVYSGLADETLARAAVNLGAQDFIVKGTVGADALARAVRYGIDRHCALAELRHTRQELAASLAETQAAFVREREALAKLEDTSRLRDDFVGIVSHDLRSPLTAIGGHARLLLHHGDKLDATTRECLEAIVRNAKQMAELISDMLDVSAIEGGGLRLDCEPFDLVEMIQRVAMDLSVGTGRVCRVRAEACPLVMGDRRRHEQILTNLVTNAFKFSDDPARVEVSIGLADDAVEVAVRDYGGGIAEDALGELFQRYSPMKAAAGAAVPSTGLGLYIVKSLVEAQGGTICVDSVVGEGTTFRYTARVATASDTGDGCAA